MKISKLRKIYNELPIESKNIKWRRITDAELKKSINQPQIVCNCYDESTRYVLIKSNKGRELLKKRIWIQNEDKYLPAYKVKLNVNKKEEIYRTTENNYWGAYRDITIPYWEECSNYNKRLSLGINIAINKMIEKHPFMKPLVGRLYMFGLTRNTGSEFNKPSNAFRWYTGKEPNVIGETGINSNLKCKKTEVKKILNRLKDKSSKEYSYIGMTGPFDIKLSNVKDSEKVNVESWHCLAILGINKKNEVILKDPRTRATLKTSFEEFISKFKAIVGIEY